MFRKNHLLKAPTQVKFSIITVSTSRFQAIKEGRCLKDESGDRAVKILESFGFSFNSRYLVSDDLSEIRSVVLRVILIDKSNLVVVIGGTGVSRSDVTIEAITPLLEKRLPFFEHIFSLLSYMQVGADAMLSRSIAGVFKNTLIVALPGSIKAVELALSKLIGPETMHVLHHLSE